MLLGCRSLIICSLNLSLTCHFCLLIKSGTPWVGLQVWMQQRRIAQTTFRGGHVCLCPGSPWWTTFSADIYWGTTRSHNKQNGFSYSGSTPPDIHLVHCMQMTCLGCLPCHSKQWLFVNTLYVSTDLTTEPVTNYNTPRRAILWAVESGETLQIPNQ